MPYDIKFDEPSPDGFCLAVMTAPRPERSLGVNCLSNCFTSHCRRSSMSGKKFRPMKLSDRLPKSATHPIDPKSSKPLLQSGHSMSPVTPRGKETLFNVGMWIELFDDITIKARSWTFGTAGNDATKHWGTRLPMYA